MVGRAAARQILGRYVNTKPESIDYAYDNLGKPRFRDPQLNAIYRFNFSNSADFALLAITRETEIGVDLERIRALSDMLGLAKTFFCGKRNGTTVGIARNRASLRIFPILDSQGSLLKSRRQRPDFSPPPR